jgi:acetyltransferase-like isoleucine patch superfamily enzyme
MEACMSNANLHTLPVPQPRPPSHQTVRDVFGEARTSALGRYRALTFPEGSSALFVMYELATMFVLPAPGAAGLLLRRKLLRPFFGAFGRNVIIGRNCVFRHPKKIFLEDNVAIDDNCMLDARGCEEGGMRIGAGTIIGRDCVIKSKAGAVRIGRNVNLGARTYAVSHSGLSIGADVGIAGGCFLNGGTFGFEEFRKPPPERRPMSTGPIEIDAGAWLATGVTVLDGVHIGANAVVSAGSVVTRNVRAGTVVQGNPAKRVFEIRG